MAQVIVRNLDEKEVPQTLRMAASQRIPQQAKEGLGTRIAKRFARIGLTEPIEELRGFNIEPLDFGS